LEFTHRYPDEDACIAALAALKWPDGFVCEKCQGRKAYHHEKRPRLYECAACGHQHSVTAGTVFHKTRTPLVKWFFAAYLMGRDKRGISALTLARELDLRYDTAWTILQKLRHALTERDEFRLEGFVEADESFYGGRRQKGNRGRALGTNKSLIVAAVEKVVTDKPHKGIKKQGFIAGNARFAVLPSGSSENLTRFIRQSIRPNTRLITDAFASYTGLDDYRHVPVVQGAGKNAEEFMPIVHILFANLKAWLNGTFHGVSAKHLPRYLREANYRFNRRGRIDDLGEYLLRRAATRPTITYGQLVAGAQPEGAC
jgi:transposase-like protein